MNLFHGIHEVRLLRPTGVAVGKWVGDLNVTLDKP
jgi:hypothetical protein